ncbi:condensin complex protein MksE [Persicobacter diffluens]|uniref:Uncharacterized protein n=1 Tax=Persicobacter diffluens TaxID=981 RepID=A0AAN4W3A6_9BACT|nr:hypothetical protein PEDI_44100 [Persicobacter diffluens]
METIKPYIAPVFDLLSKGGFLSANSSKMEFRKIYNKVEEHFEDFEQYFEALGYQLQAGNNYFYFSRVEQKYSLEEKLERFYKFIDILAFFADYFQGFGEGYRFAISEVEQKCKVDTNLSDQLKVIAPEGANFYDKVRRVVKLMTDRGFFECEDDEREDYKVLSSYNYLMELIKLIDIDEEEATK